MANETISISKEGLEEAVSKIKNAAVAVEDVFKSCDQEIAIVQQNYQTNTSYDSAGAVVEKYNSYKAKYESFLNKIIARAETLNITEDIVEQVDRQQAEKANESVDIHG